ncbi:hypothetical protein [Vibrio sp. V39_P1S14PM300]|uniref:hypothetical protein n=1 Tax=Vibrio sp. V39_P1S14PM300 TaxID=1938690 RepID=UPI001372DF01|nr:hypothetical protein [Vibrio sp. V39_P1S14PM300]NAX22960.1 hypothetical protein [Vibrio sp. V39_P1S14PM300]
MTKPVVESITTNNETSKLSEKTMFKFFSLLVLMHGAFFVVTVNVLERGSDELIWFTAGMWCICSVIGTVWMHKCLRAQVKATLAYKGAVFFAYLFALLPLSFVGLMLFVLAALSGVDMR